MSTAGEEGEEKEGTGKDTQVALPQGKRNSISKYSRSHHPTMPNRRSFGTQSGLLTIGGELLQNHHLGGRVGKPKPLCGRSMESFRRRLKEGGQKRRIINRFRILYGC